MTTRFEHWSVERYRREMGLPPLGAAHSQTPASKPGRQRVRGGSVPSAVAGKPTRKTRLLSSGHPSEEQIHRDCAAWVFEHEELFPTLRWLMHVPNGGHRSVGEAGKMKGMGVRKGVVDWIHPLPSPSGYYKGLAIEIKSHRGELSDEQEDFLHDVSEAGWLTSVARSREQFSEVVTTWLSKQ